MRFYCLIIVCLPKRRSISLIVAVFGENEMCSPTDDSWLMMPGVASVSVETKCIPSAPCVSLYFAIVQPENQQWDGVVQNWSEKWGKRQTRAMQLLISRIEPKGRWRTGVIEMARRSQSAIDHGNRDTRIWFNPIHASADLWVSLKWRSSYFLWLLMTAACQSSPSDHFSENERRKKKTIVPAWTHRWFIYSWFSTCCALSGLSLRFLRSRWWLSPSSLAQLPAALLVML